DPFEAGVWFSVLVWLNLGLFGIAGALDPTLLILPFESNPAWLVVGLGLVVLGMLAFWLAYAYAGSLSLRRRLPSSVSVASVVRERRAVGLLVAGMYVCIWVARLLRFRALGTA